MELYTADIGYYKEGFKRKVLDTENLCCDFSEVTDQAIEDIDEEIIDAATFRNLPSIVCLYRGAHKDEATDGYGQSWTLDIEVARDFAWKYYSSWSFKDKPLFNSNDRVVYQTFIPRENIIAYIHKSGRQEYECIIDPTYSFNSVVEKEMNK
jgi:hypothetical protein